MKTFSSSLLSWYKIWISFYYSYSGTWFAYHMIHANVFDVCGIGWIINEESMLSAFFNSVLLCWWLRCALIIWHSHKIFIFLALARYWHSFTFLIIHKWIWACWLFNSNVLWAKPVILQQWINNIITIEIKNDHLQYLCLVFR